MVKLSVLGHTDSVDRLILIELINDGRAETSCIRTGSPFLKTVRFLFQEVLALGKELHQTALLVDLYGQSRAFQGNIRRVL